MAEGDGYVFNRFKNAVFNGEADLVSDTIKLALMATYTPDVDNHDFWSDISSGEAAGTGYNAGGQALSGKTNIQDNTNDLSKYDATDVTWSSVLLTTPANGIPVAAILYDDTHASDLLICGWELGVTGTNGGDYTIEFGTNGILRAT